MKKVNVVLDIDCLVICPYCDNIFDLFEMDHLTEEGYIYAELLPQNNTWGKENWGEIVQCPKCEKKIIIGEVQW